MWWSWMACRSRSRAPSLFDVDDLDAAFAELDARYLAGEAKSQAHMAHSLFAACTEFGPDFGKAAEELWTLVPDARYRVTAVHALAAHGVVASIVITGTDIRENEMHWARIIVADDRRVEVYEEDDLDAALARFDESTVRRRG